MVIVFFLIILLFVIKKNNRQFCFDETNENLFNNLDDGIIIIDNKRNILQINNSAKLMFNIETKEINSLKINNILPSYSYSEEYHNYEIDVNLYRKYIALTQTEIILNKNDKCKILFLRDITEQKVLSEIWRKYEFIVNATNELMALIRNDLTLAVVNESFCKALNKKFQEVSNKNILDVWENKITDKIIEYVRICLNGEKIIFKDWVSFKKFENRFYEITFYPYINS